MPIAVVELAFDPILRLAGLAVRLETVVVAAGIVAALLIATRIALRTPAPEHDRAGVWLGRRELRADDLLYLVLAAIPGALIGGRIGYALLHVDYYRANPGAILDPGQGSLELSLAVAGAAISAGYGAWVLGESVRRWLHVAAAPTLLTIAVGKVAAALAGRGQGSPASFDWATSYLGPGPWATLAPDIPAHPSQLYEAAAVSLILLALAGISAGGAFRRRDGLAWFVGIGAWAVARAVIAATWIDPPIVGPLRAGQLLALGVAAGCAAGAIVATRSPTDRVPEVHGPSWPDPEARPRF